ncbi:MAG: DUF1385 domain-containing protein [Clostridia bacterium]|nr:DUF1385 domain-containing protein [Clostridia bacterium]
MSENKAKKTSIGGQALIEGIMMRGPEKTAMAVRDPKGEMVLKKWDNPKNTPKIAKLPLIRGVYNMVTSLITGYKCLSESAEIAMDLEELERQEAEEKALKALKKRAKKEGRPFEELLAEENAKKAEAEAAEVNEADLSEAENEVVTTEEATEMSEAPEVPEKEEKIEKKDTKKSSSNDMGIIMVVSIALALVLVVGLFVFLPEFIYNLVFGELSVRATYLDYLGRSAFTGVIKLILLVLYMWGVSFMKDIRRTFMYHGAEHKTIFCYEQGLELTVENVRQQKRFHPRCGTSFIVLVVIVGIILGGFIHIENLILRALVRIILVPLIVGIGYELIKFAGRHDNIVTKIISAPGVWLQHITTKEPDDSMIECAIKAVIEVIPEDKEKDNW